MDIVYWANVGSLTIAACGFAFAFFKWTNWKRYQNRYETCEDLVKAKDSRCPRCQQSFAEYLLKKNRSGANFCPSCGFMLTTQEQVQAWQEAQRAMFASEMKMAMAKHEAESFDKPKILATLHKYPNVKIETTNDRTLAHDLHETISQSASHTATLNGIAFPICYYRNDGQQSNKAYLEMVGQMSALIRSVDENGKQL